MYQSNIDSEPERQRVNINKFLAHLIVISMLFLLPEFIMGYAIFSTTNKGVDGIQWHMYAKSLIYIVVFYIDYYYIISHTLTPKVRLWRFLIYNILLLIGALVVSYLLWYFFVYLPRMAEIATRPIRNPEKFRLMFVSSMLRDGVMVILTVALAVALRLSDHWSTLERRRKDLASEQRASELKNLKSQLNPHFLFNTLNSIYALIEIAPAEAQTAVHELSQMLRYMLYETPAQVTLEQETDFSRNYISLMQLRLSKGIVETHINLDGMAKAPIAPLLFISLIENAFKHGNTGNDKDKISIEIIAKDDIIRCRTHNRFDNKTVVDRQGGIGIANLRRRLLLIYGDRASLSTTIEGDTYTACLEIKLSSENKRS
ncbi:MAG: sensor histidine kinase [Muribaculaceae bacterium]|nr:sensor histidine kinase [Muribaculaceae bacterium]